jgi:octaprenyl-diphosphate synthase
METGAEFVITLAAVAGPSRWTAPSRGNADERALRKRAIEVGAIEDGEIGEIGECDLATAQGFMREHKTIEETMARARHHGAAALDALDAFPASEWKTALREVVAFSIARAN